jgi:hypothetical protein
MKKIQLFANNSLDSLGVYSILRWKYPDAEVSIKTINVFKVRQSLLAWVLNNSFRNYDLNVFCSLDVSYIQDLIDTDNVLIIGYDSSEFKNAKKRTILLSDTCTESFYKTVKNLHLTKQQELFLKLIVDFATLRFKSKQSMGLNHVFRMTQNQDEVSKIERLFECFRAGFDGFDKYQKNMIEISTLKLTKLSPDCFAGNLGSVKVLACVLTELKVEYILSKIKDSQYDVGLVYDTAEKIICMVNNSLENDRFNKFAKIVSGDTVPIYLNGYFMCGFSDFSLNLTQGFRQC